MIFKKKLHTQLCASMSITIRVVSCLGMAGGSHVLGWQDVLFDFNPTTLHRVHVGDAWLRFLTWVRSQPYPHIHINMYIHIYIYIYISIYWYLYMYMYMCTWIYTNMYTWIYMYTCVYVGRHLALAPNRPLATGILSICNALVLGSVLRFVARRIAQIIRRVSNKKTICRWTSNKKDHLWVNFKQKDHLWVHPCFLSFGWY